MVHVCFVDSSTEAYSMRFLGNQQSVHCLELVAYEVTSFAIQRQGMVAWIFGAL